MTENEGTEMGHDPSSVELMVFRFVGIVSERCRFNSHDCPELTLIEGFYVQMSHTGGRPSLIVL